MRLWGAWIVCRSELPSLVLFSQELFVKLSRGARLHMVLQSPRTVARGCNEVYSTMSDLHLSENMDVFVGPYALMHPRVHRSMSSNQPDRRRPTANKSASQEEDHQKIKL